MPMADKKMPVTEVNGVDPELVSHYEFAFHILPTVAEEEVPRVFGDIKTLIDQAGGTIMSEEAPQRFDLAYEVLKSVEGRNLRYTHTYFGWVRFTLEREKLEHLKVEIEHMDSIVRFLLIKLTRAEVLHPVKFFEQKRRAKKGEEVVEKKEKVEEPKAEVSEEDIEKAVGEITA
jgi:ribosomal protein S6